MSNVVKVNNVPIENLRFTELINWLTEPEVLLEHENGEKYKIINPRIIDVDLGGERLEGNTIEYRSKIMEF